MKILIACEFSGVVRNAFAERGDDAWSCDLLSSETPGNHIRGDVLGVLDWGWDMQFNGKPPDVRAAMQEGVDECVEDKLSD